MKIINSKQKAEDCAKSIMELFDKHKWLLISIKAGNRTIKQNAWMHQAYKMLSTQGDMTELEYKAYCKTKLGLAILKETYPERVDVLRELLKLIGYEQFQMFMIDEPVTSLFDLDQGARYINEITAHFNGYELPRKDY
ncbi:hypothetical protein [Pseudoalteromonas marina]|uniref:hypothetical protein n=1 Tax=Pseudoalteromonas marina TaxID=267375 RepID=UPI003C57D1C6